MDIYTQTKEMYESLFDSPSMQISKLQKPTIKYIYEIHKATVKARLT